MKKTRAGVVPLQKIVLPYDQSTPEDEPLYINHFQIARHQAEAYIDVGVVPLDDILQQSGKARFLVLNRLVMGVPILISLRDQINEILKAMQASGELTQERLSVQLLRPIEQEARPDPIQGHTKKRKATPAEDA